MSSGFPYVHFFSFLFLLLRKAHTHIFKLTKHFLLCLLDLSLLEKPTPISSMLFPVAMYRCKSWTIKKDEHRRTDAFELWCWRSPLDCKEIQIVHPKGNQSWIFIGRTDAEAETPVLWPPDSKNWLIGKDPDAGKDWRQEKGRTGWDVWIASPTQWTWVWASSRSWWWTGKSGVLQSMGS